MGLDIKNGERWIPIKRGDPVPEDVATSLSFIPRRTALAVMTEGAQAMSNALLGARLMTEKQQYEVRSLLDDLVCRS
jgi:hypothetical protein